MIALLLLQIIIAAVAVVLLSLVLKNQRTIMSDFQKVSDQLAALKVVVDGIVVKLGDIGASNQAAKDAQAASDAAATSAALDDVSAKIDALTSELTGAGAAPAPAPANAGAPAATPDP